MKIALTVWEDRISPVFDVATMILLAEIENGQVVNRQSMPFNPDVSWRVAEILKEMGVSILICGAISEVPANIISSSGIELIPFISGKTEAILKAFAKGNPILQEFSMPGMGRQRRRRGSQQSYFTQQEEVAKMPRGNGTGPRGQGSGTGRGKGGCRQDAGRQSGQDRGAGRGQGRKGGGKGGRGQRQRNQ